MKKYLLLLSGLLCCSCVIQGELKGLFSYYDSTYESYPALFSHENILNKGCDSLDRKKVYVTNGKILKECLVANQKAVVYIWAPLCTSTFCLNLEFLQQYFNKKGIALYIVSEYYDLDSMAERRKLKKPIFGVDTKYYKTSLTEKYMKRFQVDLMNKVDTTYNRIYYFEKGVFVNSFLSIEELEKRVDLIANSDKI